jgi:hypothetical protein
MTTHYNLGDALRADRIAIQARDIDKVVVKRGSSSHRIQSTTLRGSAYCVIELPLISVQKKSQ